MAVEIKVPSVGESITEGNLARWLKKDGDVVRADEPLFELETEKATTEIASPAAGRLVISVAEGQTVAIGTVVGRIEEAAAAPTPPAPGHSGGAQATPPAKPTSAEADRRKKSPVPAPKEAAKRETAPPAASGAASADPSQWLSPSVRRLAEEEGVDVRQLSGTGRGGRVTREDVQTYLDQHKAQPAEPERQLPAAPLPVPEAQGEAVAAAPAPARTGEGPGPAPGPRETRQRMSAIRQRIAERLVAAQQTAAILTTFNEADLSALLALRSQYKDLFREKYGVNLGFMGFFVKACVEALRAFPAVNARIDGSDVVYQNFYDVAIAVSTDKGLMVPVVRGADHLALAQIEQRIGEFAQKARDGKITVGDLQGGTFTITNGGIFGSLLSTPILNPPQSAILGMHTIQKRPVVVNDQVVIRPMMYLALSYDHRLIDGREAVQFLVRVKECVERPERLLLAV